MSNRANKKVVIEMGYRKANINHKVIASIVDSYAGFSSVHRSNRLARVEVKEMYGVWNNE